MTGRRSVLPTVLGVAGAVALGLLVVVPIIALAARAPWSDGFDLLRDRDNLTALRLSMVVSVTALLLSVVIGFPMAWLLARVEFPGRRFLRALVTLPMVLPPVVGGVALLVAFGEGGLLGQWLDRWWGVELERTTAAAVLAATFVSLPFFVVTVEAALRAVDRRYEDAARTLGARPIVVVRRVTVPSIRGALGAGMALAWARALGEFGATVTFAGSVGGATRTMPLAIDTVLDEDLGSAIFLSLVLLAVSVAVLASLRDRWLGP